MKLSLTLLEPRDALSAAFDTPPELHLDPALFAPVAVIAPAAVCNPRRPQAFRAESYPGFEDEPTRERADLYLYAVPDPVQDRLLAYGARVYVYAGPAVTVLPPFRDLVGVPSGAAGDPRTFDTTTGVESPALKAAFVNAECVDRGTLHEVGHLVYDTLTPAGQAGWAALFAASSRGFPTQYEQLNVLEAWAESCRRLWSNERNPPGVNAFLLAVGVGG